MSAPRSRMNGPMRRSSSSSWGMASSAVVLTGSKTSLVRYGRARLPYRYGIRYGKLRPVGVVPAIDCVRWRGSTAIRFRSSAGTPRQSALALALRTAKRGAFRCIVIDGEPGVGKTRLATDLLARSRGRVLTLRARGHLSGSASPFGLWAELFDSHLRHRTDDEVVRLCGGYVADLSGVLRAAARLHGSWRMDVPPTHVREALTVVLSNLAREQPVVVLLDDMHLADASSWETLDYVARNMIDEPGACAGVRAPRRDWSNAPWANTSCSGSSRMGC